jgi:hypothetical protein
MTASRGHDLPAYTQAADSDRVQLSTPQDSETAAPMNMQAFIARWKPRLRRIPGYGLVRLLYDLVHSVESRHAALLLIWPPKGLYQPYATTSDDRYPEIFRFVRERIGDNKDISILSIGCSTGEETYSLRRYFPQAKILGLDIKSMSRA